MNEELNSKLMVIQVPLDLCTRGTMAGQQVGLPGTRMRGLLFPHSKTQKKKN